ncbi:hypothetical protein AMK11_22165 [Streptomyces sp. CB02414]|nr:hypothetical protein AMK11_22165 [Streptomyces sp. CB02414]
MHDGTAGRALLASGSCGGGAAGAKSPESIRRRDRTPSRRRISSAWEVRRSVGMRAGQSTACGTRHQALPSPCGWTMPQLRCQRQETGTRAAASSGGGRAVGRW